MADHTCLPRTPRWEQIRETLDDAVKYETASACIPASYVKRAAEYVQGRLPICTVIGFPNGYSTTAVKVFETRDAVANGASEIDMVINIGDLKDKNYSAVEEEIRQIHEACQGRILKVIIETCLLTEEEIIKMSDCYSGRCGIYQNLHRFFKGGSHLPRCGADESQRGSRVQVKAAGGISDFGDAQRFAELGATRLGTSRLVKLMKQ